MALINTIAAVPEAQICAFRRDSKHVIEASAVGRLSSFGIGGWRGRLGLLLNESMLGGVVVNPALVHDRDVPRYHDVAAVRSLAQRIERAWNDPPAETDADMEDWVRSELGSARDILKVASARGECMLTAWEVVGGVHGTSVRIRELGPGRPIPLGPLTMPSPVVVAGCVAGGILAAALWRRRRMRRLRSMRLPKP